MAGAPVRRGVILLSGGLDSATTLALAIRDGFEMYALSVDYGQRHKLEIQRATELARGLGARDHRTLRLDLAAFGGSALTDPTLEIPAGRSDVEIGSGIPATYVPARNTVFLSLALAWAEVLEAQDLFVGANAVDYSGYPDCRPEFLEAFEKLSNLATRAGVEGTGFRVHAPLLLWSKGRIISEAIRIGVDLAITLSCYAPGETGRPCGACDACRLRARGFREAGVSDPAAVQAG